MVFFFKFSNIFIPKKKKKKSQREGAPIQQIGWFSSVGFAAAAVEERQEKVEGREMVAVEG